jgi:thiaminase
MDWGQRLADSGLNPDNHFYREWIELNTESVLDQFVKFVEEVVNEAPASIM